VYQHYKTALSTQVLVESFSMVKKEIDEMHLGIKGVMRRTLVLHKTHQKIKLHLASPQNTKTICDVLQGNVYILY
jgi:hypothetical protein